MSRQMKQNDKIRVHKYKYQDKKKTDALRAISVCSFLHFSITPVLCYVHTMWKNDSKCVKAVQKIVKRL